MSQDEICRICCEPKSKHVPTEAGPLTHPREAAGEGVYVRTALGTLGGGPSFSGEILDDLPFERWEFRKHPIHPSTLKDA